MEDRLIIVSLTLAAAIGIWFGITVLDPKPSVEAEYDRCVETVIETGNISNDVSQVCRYLK